MRTEVCLGIALSVGAPVVLAISYSLGVIPNLTTTIEQIIILTVTAMLASGASLIWTGRKPDEQANLRREEIWKAIGEWVELPSTGFRGQPDPLPLAENPPKIGCGNRGMFEPELSLDLG
jgi:hypothetical protein